MVPQTKIGPDPLCYNSLPVNSIQKEALLEQRIESYTSVIIAFSGGVDSSYLAFMATRVLGSSALCYTSLSAAVSDRQRELAEGFASRHGLNHTYLNTDELDQPDYRRNPGNRCYFCKSELYSRLDQWRSEMDADVVLDGTNADDLSDYRPGRRAAVELGVVSPLAEVGMTKQMIRERSRAWLLETWDLPAMPCLASRFPYGTEIDRQRLRQVEKSEDILWKMGFRNFRVRYHGAIARLEVAREEMPRLLPSILDDIRRELGSLGFDRVELDEKGFRSGSLNEGISQ